MRETLRDPGRLEHILGAIDKALLYTQEIASAEELDKDTLRKHATTYNVQIIGEATYHLSKEFKDTHPLTPWRTIEKARHIIVHDYYQVETAILWSIVKNDLPTLRQQVTEYLKEFEE